ncbi:MAG: DNA adenine methylase [Deltaproteobacteria bacterium]|jgi:DNA adenine methylase|nr:DNA adenine methylase [Deltaproteobacteria bacterium]
MFGRQNDPLIKPFLKWAGGKRQLLPEIIKVLPANLIELRYYEPFIGAGALFLDRQPRQAIINDYNEQLTLTYKAIRDNVDELISALKEHKESNSKEYYYKTRDLDRDIVAFEALSTVQKAARLIYLNKTCFNGLYRVNSKGLFNVPCGHYANPAICDEPTLRAIHKYFNRKGIKIEILSGDFADAVESAGQESFIYFDPPYHSPNKTNFTGYQAGGFGEDEQRRLRDVIIARSDAGAKCLLSNSDTDFIRKLYDDDRFEISVVKAKRAINSDSGGRGDVNEALIKNWR